MNPLRILESFLRALCGDVPPHPRHRHPSAQLSRYQVNARFLAAMTEMFGPIDSAENRLAEALFRTNNIRRDDA